MSDLDRGELALLISDIDDQLETLDQADRKWGRLTLPAALGVTVATVAGAALPPGA